MNTATAQHTATVAIEDMQIGHRYIKTIGPEFNHGWTVKAITERTSDCQVMRNGEWTSLDLITVTYNNGRSITEEAGTEIAIHCDMIGG